MMEGAKMSKSFGNIIPLREGLAKFGADPIRVGVLATAELLQDADFSPTIAKSVRDRLGRLYRFASDVAKAPQKRKVTEKSLTVKDRWMLSRLQEHIKRATEAMNKLAVRKAIHSILYELDQDFQWYQKRTAAQREKTEDAKAYVFGKILDAQIRMLAPVAPHLCEEMWEMMGEKGFVSSSSWPEADESKTDITAEENEALIAEVLEDTQNIMRAMGTTPTKIYYYVAAPWKRGAYSKLLEKSKQGEMKINELMKELAADEELKKNLTQISKVIARMIKELSGMPEERRKNMLKIGTLNEKRVIEDAKGFLSERLKAEVTVYGEEDNNLYDPKQRAAMALPLRPAIYIE
jgi:leucyl-tRNA synthetase